MAATIATVLKFATLSNGKHKPKDAVQMAAFTALHRDQFAEPAGAGHGRHVASAARFCSTVMPALLTATSIAIALSTTTNPSVVATK
jgi:hypothetical protein